VKQRFLYIDRTKGLAIILVVLGHLVARRYPPGPGIEWYALTKETIYTFHMPLFIAVSGLVYGLTWRSRDSVKDDLRDSWHRVLRLLPAYLLAGLAVFFGKLAFQSVTSVDNKIQDGAGEVLTLVSQPTASYCGFLWYIYALSIIFVVFPLASRAVRGQIVWLLPITGAFWLIPSTPWFAWGSLRILSFFFVVGVMAGQHHDLTRRWLGKLWMPALAFFLAILLPAGLYDEPSIRWLTAALSVVALPGLMQATESWSLNMLETLGRYTLIIYLTNTAFIGLVKAASLHLGVWHASQFPMIAIVMTVVALGGAVLMKRYLLPLVPPLDRVTT